VIQPPDRRREQLERLLGIGIEAVDGATAVRRAVTVTDAALCIDGRVVAPGRGVWVVAFGKAAAGMASAVETIAGAWLRGGLVVTKDGHAQPRPRRLRLLESGHPVPDHRSELAARDLRALVSALPVDDTLLVLLSGGASALTSCPASGLDLADLAETTRQLLACGADIEQLNVVRKHLSAISGGRLAAAATCTRIEVLAISDVPGDRADVIGSGPCEPDPSTYADALAVLDRFGLRERVPSRVARHLERGRAGLVAETPKPGDRRLTRVRSRVIARNADARDAVARGACERGFHVVALGEVLRGEARVAACRLIALARSIRPSEPTLLIAGGETVVTIEGRGRGGRSQELALAAAIELAGSEDAVRQGPEIVLLAAGTDGTDGPTSAAGACVDAHTVERGHRLGADAVAALADNDSFGFFQREGGAVTTGPTGTNVMDLVLVWVVP
jgi:glycerate-2-kinase